MTNKCKKRFHRGRSMLDPISQEIEIFFCISIELWKLEWKFEKKETRNDVET